VSPFNKIVPSINHAAYGEFSQETIQKANQDIRQLVWIPSLKDYYTPNSYFKQFENYQGVYLKAPRVFFDGVYVMKEKYIRAGTKDLHGFYDPYHVIEFYRYLKFFPDGHAISCLSVNKIKKEKMAVLFAQPDEDPEVVESYDDGISKSSVLKSMQHGEFIIQREKLFVRVFSKTTIYEYELEIQSSGPGLFDYLKLEKQTMRMIGSEVSTLLNTDFKGNKTFKFSKVKELANKLYPY
jgi:hypothetical protein